MIQRSIIVGVEGGGGWAWAKTRTLLDYAGHHHPAKARSLSASNLSLTLNTVGTLYLSLPPTRQDDTRSMTRKSIIVAVKGGGSWAQAETQTLLDYADHHHPAEGSPAEGSPAKAGGFTASSLPLLDRAAGESYIYVYLKVPSTIILISLVFLFVLLLLQPSESGYFLSTRVNNTQSEIKK